MLKYVCVIGDLIVQRNFLEKFLNKISCFPSWIKEIIYVRLSHEVSNVSDLSYTFVKNQALIQIYIIF